MALNKHVSFYFPFPDLFNCTFNNTNIRLLYFSTNFYYYFAIFQIYYYDIYGYIIDIFEFIVPLFYRFWFSVSTCYYFLFFIYIFVLLWSENPFCDITELHSKPLEKKELDVCSSYVFWSLKFCFYFLNMWIYKCLCICFHIWISCTQGSEEDKE